MSRTKLSALLVLGLFAVAGAPADAQGEVLNAVSIDTLAPAVSAVMAATGNPYWAIPFTFDFHRVLTEHLALVFVNEFTYQREPGGALLIDLPWLELAWHPFDPGLDGFYLGPALAFGFVMESLDTSRNHSWEPAVSAVGLGAAVGYRLLLGGSFDLNFAAGLAVGSAAKFYPTYYLRGTDLMLQWEAAVGCRF